MQIHPLVRGVFLWLAAFILIAAVVASIASIEWPVIRQLLSPETPTP